MKIYELFSKRQKRIRGKVPDVYQYKTIPSALRVQVVHIWNDVFQIRYGGPAYDAYSFIHNKVCREYGMFSLGKENDLYERVANFLLITEDTEKVIDVIEVAFHYMDQYASNILLDDAIDELNRRFRVHGIGYQYESGQIIRVDSELIHSEALVPAMKMLSDPMYEGANAEFLKAHEHYRAGDYKECMNECLKAFESCIKAICEERWWKYNETDTINRLIAIVFDKELIPDFMQSHFSGLRSTLEAGVPTLRNRLSGHGQGTEEVPVPGYMAAYALHLTASNILFLARADKEMDDDIPF